MSVTAATTTSSQDVVADQLRLDSKAGSAFPQTAVIQPPQREDNSTKEFTAKLSKFLDRKDVAHSPLLKKAGSEAGSVGGSKSRLSRLCGKVDQQASSSTSGKKLNAKARIASENDLALSALRHFIESGYSTSDILKLTSEGTSQAPKTIGSCSKLDCEGAWERFKYSKTGRRSANQFDYKFTHIDECQSGVGRVILRMCRFFRQCGETLLARTSTQNRTAQSALGSSGKTTPQSAPVFTGASMLTNFYGTMFRTAFTYTLTQLNAAFFFPAFLLAVTERTRSSLFVNKSLSDNDIKIAKYRLHELLDNMSITANTLRQLEQAVSSDGVGGTMVENSALSKPTGESAGSVRNDYAELSRGTIQRWINTTEKPLATRAYRLFTGSDRAGYGRTAAEVKQGVAESLLDLKGHPQVGAADVLDEIRSHFNWTRKMSQGDLHAQRKGGDYLIEGVRAYSSLSSNGTQGIQKSVVPDLKYKALDKRFKKIDEAHTQQASPNSSEESSGEPLIPPSSSTKTPKRIGKDELRAQYESRLDWTWPDHLANAAFECKKAMIPALAKWVAAGDLTESARAEKFKKSWKYGLPLNNWRQQYARWLTYDPKTTKTGEALKGPRAFESSVRRAKFLQYAVPHRQDYKLPFRALLTTAYRLEYLAFKMLLPMTSYASRFHDKQVLARLKSERGLITRSLLAHSMGTGTWVGLNMVPFPLVALVTALGMGVELFSILSTSALAFPVGLLASTAYLTVAPLLYLMGPGGVLEKEALNKLETAATSGQPTSSTPA